MDGVLCDFYGGARKEMEDNPVQKFPQSKWGFFLGLKEIPNAINSINLLKEKYDVWILTRPSFQNLNCYTEKAKWVLDHLGEDMLKKMIISEDKSLVKGDYLIDDQNNANQSKFEGEWLEFGSDKFPNWKSITDYLLGYFDQEKFCLDIVGLNKGNIRGLIENLDIREVRIYREVGSIGGYWTNTLPMDQKINYTRLNISVVDEIIEFAYFG